MIYVIALIILTILSPAILCYIIKLKCRYTAWRLRKVLKNPNLSEEQKEVIKEAIKELKK